MDSRNIDNHPKEEQSRQFFVPRTLRTFSRVHSRERELQTILSVNPGDSIEKVLSNILFNWNPVKIVNKFSRIMEMSFCENTPLYEKCGTYMSICSRIVMRFLARVEDTDKILLKDKSKISSEPVRFYRGIQDHLEEASENNFQWLIDDVKKGFMELINDSLKSTTNSQLKKILSTNINQIVFPTS